MFNMICSKCGNNCNDGDTCCTNCGYPFPNNSQNVSQNGQTVQNMNNNYNMQNNGQYQNMNNNYNMPNNGQYQNMNYNYNMQNNGQYQNMNYNYPNRKVKSSAGIITAIVVVGIVAFIVLVVVGFIIAFPFLKTLLKENGIRGEWYCSESLSTVTQENATAHIYINNDYTFKWAKNGDENNNYYSGDYKITDVEFKVEDELSSKYGIEMTTKEGKIDGINSNKFNSVPKGFVVIVSRSDDKVHAVFTSSSGSSIWNCVKKGD